MKRINKCVGAFGVRSVRKTHRAAHIAFTICAAASTGGNELLAMFQPNSKG